MNDLPPVDWHELGIDLRGRTRGQVKTTCRPSSSLARVFRRCGAQRHEQMFEGVRVRAFKGSQGQIARPGDHGSGARMDRLTIGDLLGLCDALGISLGTGDDGTLDIDGDDIEPHQRAWLEANDVTLATALECGARLARIAASRARHRPHTGPPARTLCATLVRVLEMPARDPAVQRRR